MKWRNYKTDPPYDAYDDDHNGYETDYIFAYFVYRYTDRPDNMNHGPFVSFKACRYSQGIFEGYESHMKTSPYPSDRIEVLAWIEDDTVRDTLLEDFVIGTSTRMH